jgi:hypothetical protein
MTYQLEYPKDLISQHGILFRLIINDPLLWTFLPLKNQIIRLLSDTSPSLASRVNAQCNRRAVCYPSIRPKVQELYVDIAVVHQFCWLLVDDQRSFPASGPVESVALQNRAKFLTTCQTDHVG